MVCALLSLVENARGLIMIRFFLGIAEAGFLPGIVYWGMPPHLRVGIRVLITRGAQWAVGTRVQCKEGVSRCYIRLFH